MKATCIFILLVFAVHFAKAQNRPPVRYETDFLTGEFHQKRRAELRNLMPDSSLAILFSAPIRNRSNDNDFPFHQHPDFYYLTGFTQPNAVLLIFKNSFQYGNAAYNEILFIAPRSKEREIWTGRMADTEEASGLSGITGVFTTDIFQKFPIQDSMFKSVLYQALPKGSVDTKSDSLELADLVNVFKTKFSYPPRNGDSFLLTNFLKKLREVKQKEELTLLKKAISISCEGHKEMMRVLEPGMSEYQVEAAGEYVFSVLGAESPGYPSICGGGENSCVLHYVSNRKNLKAGDLLLLDMGAEYHGYTADVTRTLPVSGTFTDNQKIIYELVLRAQDSAFAKCVPGFDFRDPHRAAVNVIRDGLLTLGIIQSPDAYSKYFMHGTSHYLGLDVHDAGTFAKLSPGNVITIEPGVYIPANSNCDAKWWDIGIRIEDDVLITENGYQNLSISCPSSVKEVEAMMKQEPLFIKKGNQTIK